MTASGAGAVVEQSGQDTASFAARTSLKNLNAEMMLRYPPDLLNKWKTRGVYSHMKTALLLAVATASGLIPNLRAQIVFTGTYTWGTNGNTNSFPYNGVDIANLIEGNFEKVSVVSSSSGNNFRASDWPVDPSITNRTGNYDPTKYFEFSLGASPGYTLSMSNITFGLGRSATGPRTFAWASSINGFSTFEGSYSSLGGSGLFATNAGTIYFLTDTTSGTGTNVVLNLTGTTYQNLSSVTFRLYGWDSEGSGGTGGLQGPLSFSGTIDVVPEPSTYFLLMLGGVFLLSQTLPRLIGCKLLANRGGGGLSKVK